MRLFNYIIIIIGLMVLLNLGGINTTTGSIIGDIINNPENLLNNPLSIAIIAVFSIAITGGIIVGFVTKTSPESYLLAPVAAILILFVGDIIGIYVYANANYATWISNLVLLIMIPLAVGYVITTVEWWRGTA